MLEIGIFFAAGHLLPLNGVVLLKVRVVRKVLDSCRI
jgi:hypothetical protein